MVKVSTTAKSETCCTRMQEEGKHLDKTYISVGVESGGCSGLSYSMEFTSGDARKC
jgi:iron-sulfur cluster assembly protein